MMGTCAFIDFNKCKQGCWQSGEAVHVWSAVGVCGWPTWTPLVSSLLGPQSKLTSFYVTGAICLLIRNAPKPQTGSPSAFTLAFTRCGTGRCLLLCRWLTVMTPPGEENPWVPVPKLICYSLGSQFSFLEFVPLNPPVTPFVDSEKSIALGSSVCKLPTINFIVGWELPALFFICSSVWTIFSILHLSTGMYSLITCYSIFL